MRSAKGKGKNRGLGIFLGILLVFSLILTGCNNNQQQLIQAAKYGNIEEVKKLLTHGTNINAKDKNGDTALILATYEGNLEVVKLLVDHGADVNIKDKHGWTALMTAAQNDWPEITKILLDHGADVNAKTDNRAAALIYAAGKGYSEIVKTLIAHGTNINAKDKNGDTALMGAAYEGNLEVVKLLVDHGADVNAKDKHENTALSIAKGKNHSEIAQMLTEVKHKEMAYQYEITSFQTGWTKASVWVPEIRMTVKNVGPRDIDRICFKAIFLDAKGVIKGDNVIKCVDSIPAGYARGPIILRGYVGYIILPAFGPMMKNNSKKWRFILFEGKNYSGPWRKIKSGIVDVRFLWGPLS